MTAETNRVFGDEPSRAALPGVRIVASEGFAVATFDTRQPAAAATIQGIMDRLAANAPAPRSPQPWDGKPMREALAMIDAAFAAGKAVTK